MGKPGILSISTVFILVAIIELPALFKRKQWKEISVFSILLIFGAFISILDQVYKFRFHIVTQWFIQFFGSIWS